MARLVLKAGGMGGPGVPIRNGLIAEYRINDGAGTNLNDYSLSNLDGTLGAAAAAPTWATSGLTFDGGDYVTLPIGITSALDGARGATVMAAVNRDAIGVNHAILDITNATNSKVYLIVDSANKISFRVRSVPADASANVTKLTTATFTDTTRYFTITGRGDLVGAKVDVFVNGVQSGASFSATFTQTTFGVSNGANHNLGSGNGGVAPFWSGAICWVVIYNRALSQSEINKNHAYLVSTLKKSRGITIT